MPKNVCVVVLGDIGRSPRMQYHSLSLAKKGHKVDVVGYRQSAPLPALIAEPLLSLHYLPPFPNVPFPKYVNYILKTVWQAVTLLFVLLIIRRAEVVLVQNPPAVPALVVCWFYALLARAKYIIDWHNYAHTIMALSVGAKSKLVSTTSKVESYIGQKADCNFCVSNEMKQDLMKNWGISALTLYDRPPKIFKPLTAKEKMEAIKSLSSHLVVFGDFIETNQSQLNPNRPGLLVSSTSWTEDEDFSFLLNALQEYEDAYENGNVQGLRKLLCIITGKGPQKEFYCNKISALNWKHVRVITPWMEPEDYPKVLGIADLGVCLHTSSSGLDLPMKVVDMFGCGLPVCAYKFKSIHELVKHEQNGFVFQTAPELSKQIQNWFSDFSGQTAFQEALKQFQELRWEENWNNIASCEF